MSSPWSSAEALSALGDLMLRDGPVGTTGRSGDAPHQRWHAEAVELEDPDTVLIVMRIGGRRFGVRYPLEDMSEGPQTGRHCDTPAEWAGDLWGDIDENVSTGATSWAAREDGPGGLVLLRW